MGADQVPRLCFFRVSPMMGRRSPGMRLRSQEMPVQECFQGRAIARCIVSTTSVYQPDDGASLIWLDYMMMQRAIEAMAEREGLPAPTVESLPAQDLRKIARAACVPPLCP